MSLLLALFMWAAPTQPAVLTLFDDTVEVSAARARTLALPRLNEAARLICSYEVVEGASGVRAVLLSEQDAGRWARGEAHRVAAATAWARRGTFSHAAPARMAYVLALDNRLEARRAARVHLLVRLARNAPGAGVAWRADPGKGRILVWSSIALFALLALFAAARLRRALSRG